MSVSACLAREPNRTGLRSRITCVLRALNPGRAMRDLADPRSGGFLAGYSQPSRKTAGSGSESGLTPPWISPARGVKWLVAGSLRVGLSRVMVALPALKRSKKGFCDDPVCREFEDDGRLGL